MKAGKGGMACALVPDGRLETEVALFLAAQAAARAAPTPQYGTSPRLSFAAISSPGNAQHVSVTLVVSAQARPEVGRGYGMAPPCTLCPSCPLEEATSGGKAQLGKRWRVSSLSVFCVKCFSCHCVCVSLSFSDLPPFILFVSLRPSLPAVLISSS